MTFAQSFGVVLVGDSETIVRLAGQPHEPVAGPLDLEQNRCTLVVCSARLTARLVTGPRAIGESTAPYSTPRHRSTGDRRVDSALQHASSQVHGRSASRQRLTARLVTGPRAIGESTAHVLVLMFVATFGRELFGAVPEVMFS